MKSAVLAFLLALSGQAPDLPPGPAGSPAALVTEQPRPRLMPTLVGAWQGRRLTGDVTPPVPLEVTFADGLRPATVFAYFIFGAGQETSRLRRLGSLAADQVVFALADGGKITLRLDATGRRLVGSVVDLSGSRPAVSSVELMRLRDFPVAAAPGGPPSIAPRPVGP